MIEKQTLKYCFEHTVIFKNPKLRKKKRRINFQNTFQIIKQEFLFKVFGFVVECDYFDFKKLAFNPYLSCKAVK